MKLGVVFFPSVGPAERSAARYFDECFQVVDVVEQLGFHHVKMVEHYFYAYGGYSPDPVTFLAAVAGRTAHVRLGTSATIPAFVHPVKLAGKLAMLDNISHGRLDVAFGRAFLPGEFAAFGIPMDESRERFDEGVEACVRLWTETDVVWDGKYFQFGPVTMLPRPFQEPHPPVFVTSATNPDSVVAAGRAGYHLQTVPHVMAREQLQERLRLYREAWCEGGHEPGTEQIHFTYPCVVDADDQVARSKGKADHKAHLAAALEAFEPWSTMSSSAYPGYDKMLDGVKKSNFDQKLADNTLIVGSPEQARAQLENIAEWYGEDVSVTLEIHSGHLLVEDALTSLRLLADEVIPKLTPTVEQN
jgi:alkanesulfonate monooxygenase SsuD/methylene tetrahydromethanopterin reductase-like flavin-dependent oxidoreductase (luciferase family)